MNENVIMETTFKDTKLYARNLVEKRYVNCVFKSCIIERKLNNSVFENCVFEDINFTGVAFFSGMFVNCTFKHCMLRKAKWVDCRFDSCILDSCTIIRLTIVNSFMSGIVLNCGISDFNFEACQLKLELQKSIIAEIPLTLSGKCMADLVIVSDSRVKLAITDVASVKYKIDNSGYLEMYYTNADMDIANVINNKGMCLIRLQSFVLLQCSIFNAGMFVQETNYLTCNKSHIVVADEQSMFEKNIDVLFRPFVLKYITMGRKFIPKLVIGKDSINYPIEFKNRLVSLYMQNYADYIAGLKSADEVCDLLLTVFINGVCDLIKKGTLQTV